MTVGGTLATNTTSNRPTLDTLLFHQHPVNWHLRSILQENVLWLKGAPVERAAATLMEGRLPVGSRSAPGKDCEIVRAEVNSGVICLVPLVC